MTVYMDKINVELDYNPESIRQFIEDTATGKYRGKTGTGKDVLVFHFNKHGAIFWIVTGPPNICEVTVFDKDGNITETIIKSVDALNLANHYFEIGARMAITRDRMDG